MNSFTGVFQVFYLLFKRLRNMTWWLLPLFVNCQILNVEKTIEQQKQSPEGVFYKKVHLRISKKSLENTCARVSSQRDSNTCVFPWNMRNLFYRTPLVELIKKSKVHKQRVLLKILYYYTTGWLPNEAFSASLWNKTKNSSCSLNAQNTVFVSLGP